MPSFSNSTRDRAMRGIAGFTLLEVMVAVAVIAIAFITLIGAQSQSVAIATGAKFDTVASLLAQWKMAELNLREYNQLVNDTGNFGEDYPNFTWKMEVAELGEGDTGINGSGGMLKAVEVTVLADQSEAQTFVLRTIFCKKIEAAAAAAPLPTPTPAPAKTNRAR